MKTRSRNRWIILGTSFAAMALLGFNCRGLNLQALWELHEAGVDKYVGEFQPVSSEVLPNGWTKHTFDTEGGDGPICIVGSPFTSFTKPGIPSKLLIFLNGGGACWQDFYFCTPVAQETLPDAAPGIFAESFDTGTETINNPFDSWSKMFVSYCDGSVFSGDNDVADPNFPFGPVRYHRGLRNVTAALDLAKDQFPHARQIMLSGASAGGVGAAGLAPFVTRFVYGNHVKLNVFNDAGPIATNPNQDPTAIAARAADWQFGQFYPDSCTDCDDQASGTAVVQWRLDNDSTVREAFYSTDGDSTNRFFLQVPTQEAYRQVLLDGHDPLNEAHPRRYKRFIRSGDDEHTALGLDTFFVGEANGTPLYEWTRNFVIGSRRWKDIVEDFVPLP